MRFLRGLKSLVQGKNPAFFQQCDQGQKDLNSLHRVSQGCMAPINLQFEPIRNAVQGMQFLCRVNNSREQEGIENRIVENDPCLDFPHLQKTHIECDIVPHKNRI